MRTFVILLFISLCFCFYGRASYAYILKDVDVEELNEKIERLPYDFRISDTNQLIFVAPDPYFCGFMIDIFQDEKTNRLFIEFSKETGLQTHVYFWKNNLIKYFYSNS